MVRAVVCSLVNRVSRCLRKAQLDVVLMETGSSQKVSVQVIVEEVVLRSRFVEQGGKLFVGGEERGCKKLLWGNDREMTLALPGDLSSVPITHTRQLTIAYNFSSWGSSVFL